MPRVNIQVLFFIKTGRRGRRPLQDIPRNKTQTIYFLQGRDVEDAVPYKVRQKRHTKGRDFFTLHFYFLPREAAVPYNVNYTAQPQNSLPLHYSLLLITSKKVSPEGVTFKGDNYFFDLCEH